MSYSLILNVGSQTHAAEGTNSAEVSGLIYQDVTVHPGTSYQLKFAFGGNDWNQVNRGPLTVSWGTETVTVIPVEPSPPNWRYLTFDVTATSDIMRLSFSTLGAQAYPLLDDVSLIEIPEPGVARLLTLVGLIALGTRRGHWLRR